MQTDRLNEHIDITIIYYTAWLRILAHALNWHKTDFRIPNKEVEMTTGQK